MNSDIDRAKENTEPMDTVEEKLIDTSKNPDYDEMEESEEDTEEEIDDDSRAEAGISFRVSNVSGIREKEQVLSAAVIIRNLPWKIMLMQRPNTNGKSLGFFLQCNAESESSTWSVQAQAELKLVHPEKPELTNTKKIHHVFYFKENDWGFSHFIPWNELLTKGFVDKRDTLLLEAKVQAEAPHGVCWDSKKYTGCVGLKNQGATCYMNSLLQTLFFTNKLRKAVYLMPTETDDTNNSVPLAMQRVFFDLQFSDKPVGTKKLTKSFGWETLDSFMQHDVQELSRVLLDNMENRMKGTVVDGCIPRLFQGKMESYIKCKNVRYTSSREEAYYDIQLNVKGIKDLKSSFHEYVAVETLDGVNKYDAGDLGMQEAEKGVRFLSLPPVLHLQLMRFQYDPMTDSNIKINDRFEFPERLKLDEFESVRQDSAARYRLHSVLVHTGDNHGGHYVAYISPKCNGKWFRFDDDVVSKCTRHEAINNNYGGSDEELAVRNCTNAYMLVYIRQSAMADVLCDVSEADIPASQVERFNEEKLLETQRRKERIEAHLYMGIELVTEDDFDNHQGPDLYDRERVTPVSLRAKKSCTVRELLDLVADHLKYPVSSIRLWPINCRQNRTYRVACINYAKDIDRKICEVAETPAEWTLYVERLPPEHPHHQLPDFDPDNDVLLFIKRYCPKRKALDYCGQLLMSLRQNVSEMIPMLNQRAGFPKGTELLLYEEVRCNQVELISRQDVRVADMIEEIMDGDIIVFQRDEDLQGYETPTPKEYIRDLYHRIEIQFLDKARPAEPGFILQMSQKSSYDQMATQVGRHLGCDPGLLQFLHVMPYKDAPGSAIKCTFDGYIKELFISYSKTKAVKRLFYQQLSMPVNELENKRQVRCTFVSLRLRQERELVLYPERGASVRAVLEEARKQVLLVGAEGGGSGQMRLLELMTHRIHAVLSPDAPIPDLMTSSKTLRVEEIPGDQLTLQPETEMLVPCAHYNREIYQSFGVPFLVKLKQGSSFSEVRQQIQKLLEVPDKEFQSYKFAIISAGTSRVLYDGEENDKEYVVNLRDFSIKHHVTMAARPWLGIDHINRAKRPRYNYFEKAIKIHN